VALGIFLAAGFGSTPFTFTDGTIQPVNASARNANALLAIPALREAGTITDHEENTR
jgi:hypothetical protein